MKYLSTVFMSLGVIAYASSTSGDLGVHMMNTTTMQNADRARALLKSEPKNGGNTLLDMVEVESLGGVGGKANDTTYTASGGSSRIDRHIGDSTVLGLSAGGIYTEVAGNTVQSQDLSIMTNLYGATKFTTLPLGAFVDFGYANFLGDNVAFGNRATSALGGVVLNLETDTQGLTYSPLLMFNSLYLEDNTTDSSTYNGLKMTVGLEFDYAISKNYTASLKGLYSYEFKDTAGAYNYNNFTGNYTSLGEVGNESLQFGAGLNYNFNDTISAGFDYSIYLYDNFILNNLSIKLGLSF